MVKGTTGRWLYSRCFAFHLSWAPSADRAHVSCVRIGCWHSRSSGSEWELASELKKIREASPRAIVSNERFEISRNEREAKCFPPPCGWLDDMRKLHTFVTCGGGCGAVRWKALRKLKTTPNKPWAEDERARSTLMLFDWILLVVWTVFNFGIK